MRVRTLLSALAAVALTGPGLCAMPAAATPVGAFSHAASYLAAHGLDVHCGRYLSPGRCRTARRASSVGTGTATSRRARSCSRSCVGAAPARCVAGAR
jgi:hypothetical protein